MPTISDVAKRAGVSPGTVSRVINGASNVTPENREKVEQAIAELGYVPNVVARSLRLKRTRSIALLVPDITNIFWNTLARGVEDAAQGLDYSVLLCNTDETPTKQRRYLNTVASQQVDGVILAPYDSDARHLARLRDQKIPTVIIDRRLEGWEVDSVYGASVSGARAAVQHLLRAGHSRIGLISGPTTVSTAQDRVAGYCIALTEAGIPVEPRLIKYGEYRSASGEHLTYELLDEDLEPTAILATNNAIAVGVIEALERRGLRIPQDMALVCFGNFHSDSRYVSFLTAVVQPAYEMGMNAAQLLFSRLDGDVDEPARRVILPARLNIRFSCGSRPVAEGAHLPHLFSPPEAELESTLVKPLSPEQMQTFSGCLVGIPGLQPAGEQLPVEDKPDVTRLLQALQHQEPERAPHFELQVTGKAIYEQVLNRKIDYDLADVRPGGRPVTPEDQVEFAQRLGLDAVTCNFVWQPNAIFEAAAGNLRYVGGTVKSWADLDDLEPPPSLADQLSYLDRYVVAVEDTGLGIAANFTSFFNSALLAVGWPEGLKRLQENRIFLETLMDLIVEHQERVLRSVCSRFAANLAFIVISDDLATATGLPLAPDLFRKLFGPRMQRLMAPAKECGLPVVLHTSGKVDGLLPILVELGFAAVHPVDPNSNDIFGFKAQWGHKLTLMGGFPIDLLISGSQKTIETKVRDYCTQLASGGGYVFGVSADLTANVPPENFVAMTRAIHRFGRTESGQEK